jgi:YrbI family 3-deoxy-D-manno-octulosonate 8-phosphate phosphatase
MLNEVAYVGNDVNDLEALQAAGLAVAVADARPEALEEADLVLERAGGRGALRELCDLILAKSGKEVP